MRFGIYAEIQLRADIWIADSADSSTQCRVHERVSE